MLEFDLRDDPTPEQVKKVMIPSYGPLPSIPYKWSTRDKAVPVFSEGDGQTLIQVKTGNVQLTWIQEYCEWLGFEKRTGGTVLGPWTLDTSYKLALLEAMGFTTIDFDISLVDRIRLPSMIEPRTNTAEVITRISELHATLATPPEEIQKLMALVSRLGYGHEKPTPQQELLSLGKKLNIINRRKPADTIIYGAGWHRSGEYHGGYPYEEEERDMLGRGAIFYSRETTAVSQRYGSSTYTNSTEVEIFRQLEQDLVKLLFVAKKKCVNDGYVGIDNHWGTDTDWTIINLRMLTLE